MNTRSKDKLLNLAKIYVEMGFPRIPADEIFIKEPEKIDDFMNKLWQELEDKARLKGRSSTKGTREPLVGRIVGEEYEKLIKEYTELIEEYRGILASQQQFGRKRKVSAAQKKSRTDAKKAMNIMWKEGITLKQAWKKVKSGSKK